MSYNIHLYDLRVVCGYPLYDLTFSAQCLDNCDDCSSADSTRVDAHNVDFDVNCDTCADEMILVATMMCYGRYIM